MSRNLKEFEEMSRNFQNSSFQKCEGLSSNFKMFKIIWRQYQGISKKFQEMWRVVKKMKDRQGISRNSQNSFQKCEIISRNLKNLKEFQETSRNLKDFQEI